MNDAPTPPAKGRGKTPLNGRLTWGLLLIGTGRAAGFAQFGATGEAFLASLAPWLGLLIVLSGTLAWSGRPRVGGLFLLFGVCNLLAPPVIADGFCRLWGRRERWALYANVLNCAQWLMPVAFIVLVPLASVAALAGVPPDNAALLLLCMFVIYTMWFHWFAARHTLQISAARAVLVMLVIVFGTALLLHIPSAMNGRSSLSLPDFGMAPTASPGR